MSSSFPAAVLFDMDGTLVNSEDLWSVSLDQLATEYGGVLDAPLRESLVGADLATTSNAIIASLGLAQSPDEVGERLLELTEVLFAAGLPWKPGAMELLDELRAARVPIALVTSTRRRLVEVALDTLGRFRFDVVVCGDEVRRNKPHPECYQRAASLLGVDPHSCVAIEDSPVGTASAQAAGALVVVCPDQVPVPPGPQRILVTSLAEVSVAWLRKLRAGPDSLLVRDRG